MRSMVEGASSVLAPSTTLRAVPLPRCAGEDFFLYTKALILSRFAVGDVSLNIKIERLLWPHPTRRCAPPSPSRGGDEGGLLLKRGGG